MTQPQRIDWPRVIRDLMERGMSQRAIGRSVGRSRYWVLKLRRGFRPEPKFVDGCNLTTVWSSVCEKQRAEVPRKP